MTQDFKDCAGYIKLSKDVDYIKENCEDKIGSLNDKLINYMASNERRMDKIEVEIEKKLSRAWFLTFCSIVVGILSLMYKEQRADSEKLNQIHLKVVRLESTFSQYNIKIED